MRRDEHAHVENPLQVAGVARFGVVPIVRALCVCVCVCVCLFVLYLENNNKTKRNKHKQKRPSLFEIESFIRSLFSSVCFL